MVIYYSLHSWRHYNSFHHKTNQIKLIVFVRTTWRAERLREREILPIWLKETLTEFCVRDAVARVFFFLVWTDQGCWSFLIYCDSGSSTSCILTVWGLNLCHWHCIRVYILWVRMWVYASVCILTLYKKLCGGNVKTLDGVCVCVMLSLSLSGETVCSLPQCIKAHSVALGEGRNSVSISLSLSLATSSPSHSLHASIIPFSFYPSLWQGRCSPLAVAVSIFTVHFTLAPRWSAAASREKRGLH